MSVMASLSSHMFLDKACQVEKVFLLYLDTSVFLYIKLVNVTYLLH